MFPGAFQPDSFPLKILWQTLTHDEGDQVDTSLPHHSVNTAVNPQTPGAVKGKKEQSHLHMSDAFRRRIFYPELSIKDTSTTITQ